MSDTDYYVKTTSILPADSTIYREGAWCLRASARSALDGTPTGRMDNSGLKVRACVRDRTYPMRDLAHIGLRIARLSASADYPGAEGLEFERSSAKNCSENSSHT